MARRHDEQPEKSKLYSAVLAEIYDIRVDARSYRARESRTFSVGGYENEEDILR